MLQSMDQGVIAWLKSDVANARDEAGALKRLEGSANPYSDTTTLKSTEWLADSWSNLGALAISNYWGHSGQVVDKLKIDSILN
uniref:Uncharacterized protein n=1 Tax=Globisporangium ultimum (strain ATCC 200006 / CBS 805.95 / DAOM BR144) TaxID=431595 RepID=K3XBY1_GLOUD